jgi:hypothetical protein
MAGKGGGKPWTLKSDMAADRRAGVKQGSARDNALDKKRGVPTRTTLKKGK